MDHTRSLQNDPLTMLCFATTSRTTCICEKQSVICECSASGKERKHEIRMPLSNKCSGSHLMPHLIISLSTPNDLSLILSTHNSLKTRN